MDKVDTLEISHDGAVGVIRLTRPELHNRFDDSLHMEVTSALSSLARDRSVRAIVLASTGKMFAGGADFDLTRACNKDPALARRVIDDGKRIIAALIDTPQPIVVALHGDVVGVACTIVLGCDLIVAARSVRLLDPHVKIGLAAGDGACLMWPMSAGMQRAKRHLLTGDPITAEEAYGLGLVSDLVDTPDAVFPAALALAGQVASLPPLAVQGTKAVLNNLMRLRAAEIVEMGFMHSQATIGSQDLLEAIDAFTERRPGIYQGH
jgi:enoyl-CoA hydratase